MSDNPPEAAAIDGSDFFFGIVAARYNSELVDALLARVKAVLKQSGVRERNIEVLRVPGSNEIPYAVHMLASTGQFDCLIALGVVIAGETSHHEVISYGTAYSLHSIGMQSEIPVINGILTVGSLEQGQERVNAPRDRGAEFARAALQMAWHKLKLVDRLDVLESQKEDGGKKPDDEDEGFDPKQVFKNN